jgi:hypothetical protein
MNWQEWKELKCEIKDCGKPAVGFAWDLPPTPKGYALQIKMCQSCYEKAKIVEETTGKSIFEGRSHYD